MSRLAALLLLATAIGILLALVLGQALFRQAEHIPPAHGLEERLERRHNDQKRYQKRKQKIRGVAVLLDPSQRRKDRVVKVVHGCASAPVSRDHLTGDRRAEIPPDQRQKMHMTGGGRKDESFGAANRLGVSRRISFSDPQRNQTMVDQPEYDEQQQELAAEFAAKLEDFARKASAFMSPHAIATAMIGTGVGVSVAGGSHETTADWLRAVADEVEAAAPRAN